MAVEDICKNDKEDRCEANSELPDLVELIEVAESSAEDVARFAEVLRQVGRRVKASPEDRDLLSDFEGISQICDALSKEPHQWQGEAMLAFCRTMPDVCRTSVVNRASLRDAGFLAACIRLLYSAACEKDEATAVAASTALAALCTASDANKQMAMVPHQEPSSEKSGQHGVLRVLLDVLVMFPDSAQAQAESMAALRSLVVDDDTRKAEIAPSALENRELLLGDELYPEVKRVVQNACQLSQHHPQIVKLGEQALLLLREIARGQDRIQEIAKPSNKLLAFVQKSMESSEPRIVRAAMAVLRAFALCEDVRDELSLSCETCRYVQAIQRHLAIPVVCEQGFGLLANLTLRNPAMASFLNDTEHQVVSLGQQVLQRHSDRPDVTKSVMQLLWSVARQNTKALGEVRELELFVAMRSIVTEHQTDPRWHDAVEVVRQFLREFREDAGVQRKAIYNDYY